MKTKDFRKPFIRSGLSVIFMASFFIFISCGLYDSPDDEKTQKIKVMNWNLQTFFDAEFDGNEYTDFKTKKSGWNQKKYEERLDRLASVIKTLDADVVVMEELEKEAQLQDIANRLSGTFELSKTYHYAFFSGDSGSSIGCAVLSRFPIDEITAHTMDIRLEEKQPAMRAITQFTLNLNEQSLVVFVNHWKSKSGGAEESEIWRKRQEALLANLIFKARKENKAVLAAGDFNRNISEFDYKASEDGKTNIILHGKQDVEVYSPWFMENGTYMIPGSYWYKDEWERIDHFFACGPVEIRDFAAETGEWADGEGQPLRYQVWNGKGYSDHLPITCTVRF